MAVRPAKTQISLGIRPVWSESSVCTHWVAKDPGFLYADSEDSDQPGQMPRLICVFAGQQPHCWFCHEAAHFRIRVIVSDVPMFCIFMVLQCVGVWRGGGGGGGWGIQDCKWSFCSFHGTKPVNLNIWAWSWQICLFHIWTTKAQISLRIRAIWSLQLLFAAYS